MVRAADDLAEDFQCFLVLQENSSYPVERGYGNLAFLISPYFIQISTNQKLNEQYD
jgi:hypothetical protein